MQNKILVNESYLKLCDRLSINKHKVLADAGLLARQFKGKEARLNIDDYFSFWCHLEMNLKDSKSVIEVSKFMQQLEFDPCSFAAKCSPNLEIAIKRIAKYKALVGPMRLKVEPSTTGLKIGINWLDIGRTTPNLLNQVFLVYLMQIARDSTGVNIVPHKITLTCDAEDCKSLKGFYGILPASGKINEIIFKNSDTKKPFYVKDMAMWRNFEPKLQKQLSSLNKDTPTHERVASVILETMPSGQTFIDEVASRLGMSRRTLQRRLLGESMPFKEIVKSTRQRLAKHYITNTNLSYSEIAFLIGFQEETSFFRAFKSWTNQTVNELRQKYRS